MKKRILIISLTIILVSLIGLNNFSEIQAENQSEINKAVDYLVVQPSDPWITMALIAGGKTDSDLNYLKTINGSSATDYEKIILAITAAGKDPRTFGDVDFIGQLEGFYQNNQIGSPDLLNDDFWGILALASAGEDSSSQIIQDSKNFILANQNSDGGWGYGVSVQSDTNDTAAAIMALLEVGIKTDDPVIVKAVDYLKTIQNNDGGFPYGGGWGGDSDSGSDSWVISAIYKLGQNPYDWLKNNENPVDHLKSLQMADGSFKWIASDDTGYSSLTAYAVIALAENYYPINTASTPVVSGGGSGATTHTINASTGEHGSIFLLGMISAVSGSDEAFIITPDTGYHVLDVLVDGVSVGTLTSYTFTNIKANHTIVVNFAVDIKAGDITGDNIVNEYDFIVLTEDWGQAGSSPADLNHDGVVDEYDFALLMFNWGE